MNGKFAAKPRLLGVCYRDGSAPRGDGRRLERVAAMRADKKPSIAGRLGTRERYGLRGESKKNFF
jgi:hypothetical protein